MSPTTLLQVYLAEGMASWLNVPYHAFASSLLWPSSASEVSWLSPTPCTLAIMPDLGSCASVCHRSSERFLHLWALLKEPLSIHQKLNLGPLVP